MPAARWSRSTRYTRALARSTNQRMNAIFRSIIGMSVATVAFIMLFLSDQGTRTPEVDDDIVEEDNYFGRDPTDSPNFLYKIIREGSRGDELSAEVIISDTVQSANRGEEPNFYSDLSPKKMAYIDKKLRQAFEISGIKEEVNDPNIKLGKIVERREEMLKKKKQKTSQGLGSSKFPADTTYNSGSAILKNLDDKGNVKSTVNRDTGDNTTDAARKNKKLNAYRNHDMVMNGSSLNKRTNSTYLNTSANTRNQMNDNRSTLLDSSDNDDNNGNDNNTLNHTSRVVKHVFNLIKNASKTGDTVDIEKTNKTINSMTQGSTNSAQDTEDNTAAKNDNRNKTVAQKELSIRSTMDGGPPRPVVNVTTTPSSPEDANELQLESAPKPKEEPLIYVITPTYKRPEQLAELTRLGQTLMHVKRIHWLVVEDAISPSALVIDFLRECVVPHTYLLGRAVKKHNGAGKARGVSNRNSALKWIKRKGILSSVFYFADDDNTYDYRIFNEIRKTRQVSMFPVGLVTKFGVSSPIVRNGKVTGFYDGWIAGRKFPVDMAGFAVNVQYYFEQGAPLMPYTVGYEEDGFLQRLNIQPNDIEPLADNCTKVMVWHTRTIKNALAQPMPISDKVSNTNLEKLKAHLLFQPSGMP